MIVERAVSLLLCGFVSQEQELLALFERRRLGWCLNEWSNHDFRSGSEICHERMSGVNREK